MTTPVSELTRVRHFHFKLDEFARIALSGVCSIDWGEGLQATRHIYTAAEVRAWPEMKAAMRKDWANYGASLSVLCVTARLNDCGKACASLANDNDLREHAGTRDAVARGLCIYREMLDDEKPATPKTIRGYSVGQRVYIKADWTTQTSGVITRFDDTGANIDNMWFGWDELSSLVEPKGNKPCSKGNHGFDILTNVCKRCHYSRTEVARIGQSESVATKPATLEDCGAQVWFEGSSEPKPDWVETAEKVAEKQRRQGPDYKALHGSESYNVSNGLPSLAGKKPDPYKRAREEGGDDDLDRMATDSLPANQAARARNIAALAAELRKPVGARFPPESRSCRVYRRNDR